MALSFSSTTSLLALSLTALACSGSNGASSSDGTAGGCDPGQASPCACTDGSSGTQTCNADGTFLSACVCEDGAAAGPGGGATSMGTGGATGGGNASGGAVAAGGGAMGGAPLEDETPAAGGAPGGAGGAPVGSGGAPPSDEVVYGEDGTLAPLGTPEVIPSDASCTGMTLAAVEDYGAPGPFGSMMIENTGPDGQYTMFRPQTLGGTQGFVHPPITWGNGIFTTPQNYLGLLETIASHGFVVIASNSTNVTSSLMLAGLDWLLAQNGVPGDLQGMLAPTCAATVGYSLGGGASVDSGSHPNVITTISFHGLQGAAEQLHGPLFLLTSTNDGFVTKGGYVVPTYNRSTVVPTLMATLEVPGAVPDDVGHLIPLNDAREERAPAVAWLRYWVLGDQGARHWFFGSDCVLCQTPWVDIQRKNASWD